MTSPDSLLSDLRAAQEAKQNRDWPRAQMMLDLLLARGGDDLRVWRSWVDCKIQTQRPDAAIAAILQSPHRDHPAMQIFLARALRYAGRAEAAVHILLNIVQTDPHQLEARYEFGQAAATQLPIKPNSDFKKISVVLPTRFLRHPETGDYWLQRALNSLRQQTVATHMAMEFCIGIDAGAEIPDIFRNQPDVIFCPAPADAPRGWPPAANAAAARASGDILGFLEDDDFLLPERFETVLALLQRYDFVSSTQATVDLHDQIFANHDYATPSTWVMRRELWDRVGPLNLEFPWHPDAEWLGRLNQSGALRSHQTDLTVPQEWVQLIAARPFFFNYQTLVGIGSGVHCTGLAHALCRKVMHSASLTEQVQTDHNVIQASLAEYKKMEILYGRRPY